MRFARHRLWPSFILASLFFPAHLCAQLSWDAISKHIDATRTDTNATLFFNFTNLSSDSVVMTAVQTSCHCTIAKVPTLPWTLAPKATGSVEVIVEKSMKWGTITKTIAVETSKGTNVLTVSVTFPEPDQRGQNRVTAFADRQAVFHNPDCASCHLRPAAGKMGEALYKTICAICHESEHRGEMVPDLASLKTVTDAKFWEQTLRIGKPGTFMPAFSKPFGGPLSDNQLASLVTYLSQHFPSHPGKDAE